MPPAPPRHSALEVDAETSEEEQAARLAELPAAERLAEARRLIGTTWRPG